MSATDDRTAIDGVKADRTTLVDALKQAGGQFTSGNLLKCPFHHDRTASGSVHRDGDAWLYTCHVCSWNQGKSTGDVFAVVMVSDSCDFKTAIQGLGVEAAVGKGKPRFPNETLKPSADKIAQAKRLADDAARRLLSDPEALDHLWRTRGIDRRTAEQLGIGVSDEPEGRFWTLPVQNGDFVGLKYHRYSAEQQQKSKWFPKGVSRAHLFPVCLDYGDPIFVCPGELKAAAVVGVGVSAVGVTAGEGTKGKPALLPDRAISLLRGRPVVLPPDDDEMGRIWGPAIQRQLADAGSDTRIVDLGFDKQAGLADIGDWIVRELVENAREPAGVKESLLHTWRLSDLWRPYLFAQILADPRTWKPVEYVATGFREVDLITNGGLRTRAVHLLCGKPGQAKTTMAIQIAHNASRSGIPTGVFSLELGREEVAQLVTAQGTGIPRSTLAAGELAQGYQETFREFRESYADISLTIIDDDRWPGGLDRDKLAGLVAEGVGRFGWRLVLLDYLGLLAAGENDRSDYQTDLLNSTTLRRIARKNDIALVVVSALRKNAKLAKPDEVTLDDVIGAGRLTYDAASVWFVSSTQQYGGQDSSGTVTLKCLKARFSGAASSGSKIILRWVPRTGQIRDYTQGSEL